MAIACEPKLLIADEPTTALDVTIQKQILDLISQPAAKAPYVGAVHHARPGRQQDIADSVVVMQSGEIREQGPVKAIFESPQHPYTKALLACRPRLDHRPMRLPVIDDFMRGDGHPHRLEERPAHDAVGPDHPGGEEPQQGLHAEGGALRQTLHTRREGRELLAAQRQDAGTRGRIGLGQDDSGLDAHAAARCHERRGALRGHGPAASFGKRDDGLPQAHPDHLPESLRVAESAHDRGPDPHRAYEDPSTWQGLASASTWPSSS